MTRHVLTACALLLTTLPAAHAAPIDLATWTAESYPAVAGFPAGNWSVAADGSNVTQTSNGQATIFYSDFNAFGTKLEGTVRVGATSDDDFIGFVLGFLPGDTGSTSADYLLIDWKRSTQDFNFASPSTSPGGFAPAGLAASRVTGIPDADELWQHDQLAGTPAGSGVDEIARGATLGASAWDTLTDYVFSFDFGPGNLVVAVDGVEQFNFAGSFDNGRFGFYNFSQNNVTYSAFEVTPGSFPVPEPATMFLLGAALLGAGRLRYLARTRID